MLNKIHQTKGKERVGGIREGKYDPDTIFVCVTILE